MDNIKAEVRTAIRELLEFAKLTPGDIVVIGCSSSEIAGGDIGKASSPAIGAAVCEALSDELSSRRLFLAAQCCEHLNRALVIERAAAIGLERVNAVPRPNAGGSFATAAYAAMEEPILVSGVSAAAGMDIGGTLIGMHLRPVAVPIKLKMNRVGSAHVTAARTRPRFVGGARAVYNEDLL